MRPTFRLSLSALLLASFCLCLQPTAFAQKSEKGKKSAGTHVLWRDPGHIPSRDLRHGPGSPELAPQPPFTFVEEVKSGESPKFKVVDARGVKWNVKLGPEAQSETAATRLVWAVGYFAEEAYYFDEVKLENIPRLSRGREYVVGRTVRGARFEPDRPRWCCRRLSRA
jgi:hypothetical protein